ncbi:hypothetical protein CCYA_CCYA03G0905 [Cyanidiococcus yangmingshanensis]|nr:hypothetical protein CCYA_CCYA03G0905 [Cyanidiococcus yangmingshanensis]
MLGNVRTCLGFAGRVLARVVSQRPRFDCLGLARTRMGSTPGTPGVQGVVARKASAGLQSRFNGPTYRSFIDHWRIFHAGSSTAAMSGLGGLILVGISASKADAGTGDKKSISGPDDESQGVMYGANNAPQVVYFRPGDLEQNLDAVLEWLRNMGDRVRRTWASREGRTILALIALNGMVYLGWKSRPGGPPFMWRHFACSLESIYAGRTHTLLTSSISHMGFLHLLGNMFLLANFGLDVCKALGPSRFLTLYAGGAFLSSAVSLLYKRLRLSGAVSVGASGSVMAILVMFAMLFPKASLYVMGIKMTAKEACLLWVLFDVAGVVGRLGYIDFAAHLGGALFGYLYFSYIEERLREEMELRRRARRWGLGGRVTEGSSSGLLSRLDAVLEWLQRRRDPAQRRAAERMDEQTKSENSGSGGWLDWSHRGALSSKPSTGERSLPSQATGREAETPSLWQRLRRAWSSSSSSEGGK